MAVAKLNFLTKDDQHTMERNKAPGTHFNKDPRAKYIDLHLAMAA